MAETNPEREAAGRGPAGSRVLVWDLPLRLCHWGFALAVAGSFTTHYLSPAAFEWHVRFGWATLALVLFRLAWGAIGPRYARFGSFFQGAGLAHTPLGALMAIALIACLLAQSLTGLFSNDEVLDAGPLAGWLSLRASNRVSGWHGTVSNLVLAAVIVHVGAALFYRVRRRDDRITPLVTGYKGAGLPASGIGSQRPGRAVVAALLIVAGLAWLAWHAPPPLDLAP